MLSIAPKDVDPDLPLSAWGINLVAAIGLVEQLSEALGWRVELCLVYKHNTLRVLDNHLSAPTSRPTISSLALVCTQCGSAQDCSLIVTLRIHGQGNALFCIPPAGGAVSAYVRLAVLLDCPVFAIKARSHVGGQALNALMMLANMIKDYMLQI